MTTYLAWAVTALLIIYFVVELAYGGGNPNHPSHNRSDRYGGRW